MLSIDIVVPTYNRPDDIKKFVDEILSQSYDNFNVFIIDDHGEADLSWLLSYNSKIHYTRLSKNQGQASARNIGIKKGVGDIVVSLDDDAWFYKDIEALKKVANYFMQPDKPGCVMFDIIEPDKKWLSEIRDLQEGEEIGSHITCGCAYQRKALEKIGGFNEFFHSGAEESDIAFKLIYNNYKLIFGKGVKVYHNYHGGERSRKWYNKVRYNTTRNDLLIVLMYFPKATVLKYFFGKYASHLKFSLLNKRRNKLDQLTAFFLTILTIFVVPFYINRIRENRRELSKSKFIKWLNIRW
jgi:glycosyltransferase involved in cell wall biosynthesis